MTDPAANPLAALPLVRAMRESAWAYPLVATVHTVGFSILVGSVVAFDLRVLGLTKALSVRSLSRHLLPWSVAALALIVPSGFLLFLGRMDELLASGLFQLKMGLLMLAGINAVIFRTGPYQTVAGWDTGVAAPALARASVSLSIALWIGILACGRWLAPR
jgi:hypothetical protein